MNSEELYRNKEDITKDKDLIKLITDRIAQCEKAEYYSQSPKYQSITNVQNGLIYAIGVKNSGETQQVELNDLGNFKEEDTTDKFAWIGWNTGRYDSRLQNEDYVAFFPLEEPVEEHLYYQSKKELENFFGRSINPNSFRRKELFLLPYRFDLSNFWTEHEGTGWYVKDRLHQRKINFQQDILKNNLPTMTFGKIIPEIYSTKYYGFIYSITFGDKFYIGRKQFNDNVDYKYYKSSSNIVKDLIEKHGINKFEFNVLYYATCKEDLNYLESKLLFKNDALENSNCLNQHIDEHISYELKRNWIKA